MRYISTLLLSFFTAGSFSQTTHTLRGTVLSAEEQKPVAGASVEIRYKNARTITNKEGSFSISGVDLNDTVIISHTGYEDFQVVISGFADLLVKLEPSARQLEEITLSTGYQKIPKERSTGSFTQIDNRLFNEQAGTNVLDRLKYISNGVTYFPNRVPTVAGDQLIIRGISTLTMSIQKPLIVIDNFEYQGDLNNINPNDVENITFLKDAAAGSIWGAKAANGVIVITTKKGRYNQRTKIELNTNVSFTDKPDLFYYRNISSSDLIDIEKFLFSQGYRLSDTSSPLHPAFSPVYEILLKQQNGEVSAAAANAGIDALRNHDVRNDFLDYLYRKAVNQQYAVNVRGGSDNISWLLSGGFDKNISTLDAQYKRVNFRIDNTYRIARNFEVNTSIYYSESRSVSGKPGYGDIQTMYGSLPVYTKLADDNGNALPLYTQYRQGYIDTLGGGSLLDWRYYPIEDYKHSRSNSRLRDINAVIGLKYQLFDWLSADMKYRYEKQQVENQSLYDESSYAARDLINGFSQIDPNTGQLLYIVPEGSIIDKGYAAITAQNIRAQLNFNRSWGSSNITAIAGSEMSETINSSNYYRTYGYKPDILLYTNVDYRNVYPHFIYGSNWVPNPAGFDKTNTRFASFYGNASYSLKSRYTITGSMRRDASNLFGVKTNDKWKPLWSAGLMWNISNESFYNRQTLPLLKLRLTYGWQGNIDPSKVGVTTLIYQATNYYTSTQFSQINNFENPELKWEQTAMLNAGLDFKLRSGKISGSLEYYHKHITDLYGPSKIDVTTGLGTQTIIKNVGELKGNGLDIALNSVNIDGEFRWSTSLIFNTYKDRVVKYYNDSLFKASQLVNFGLGLEGKSPFSLIVYKWGGLDPNTGDPQGYENGHISEDWNSITADGSTRADIKYIGSRLPLIFGSLSNTFSWKNLALTANITYKFKYYFLRESINYNSLVTGLQGHSDYAIRWQKPGDEAITNVPSFIYPGNTARDIFYTNSEVLVEKGDHIRFQYINVSYDIIGHRLHSASNINFHLYAVINNVGIIWKATKQSIDPDYSSVPPSKSYSLGVKIDF